MLLLIIRVLINCKPDEFIIVEYFSMYTDYVSLLVFFFIFVLIEIFHFFGIIVFKDDNIKN